ncbi:hypothetical protein [Streptomyces ureilyticus]
MLQDGARASHHGQGDAELFRNGTRGLFRAGTAALFRNGTGLDRDHRGLSLGQAAAPEIDRQDVDVGGVALKGDEDRFGAGAFACGEPGAPVEDAPLAVEDDGLKEPVLLDVVGEGGQFVLVEQWDERGGRVRFDDVSVTTIYTYLCRFQCMRASVSKSDSSCG